MLSGRGAFFLQPSFGYDETSSKSSNNSFSGQTNAPRAYQAQPDIFGRVRAYPDIVSPTVVEYVNNDRTLKHYFWITRGSAEVSDVRYADTYIGDYTNSQHFVYDNVPIPTVIEQFANAAVDNNIIVGVNEGASTGISFTEPVISGSEVTIDGVNFIVAETSRSVIAMCNIHGRKHKRKNTELFECRKEIRYKQSDQKWNISKIQRSHKINFPKDV